MEHSAAKNITETTVTGKCGKSSIFYYHPTFFSDFGGNCTVLFISIIKTGSSVIVKLSEPTGRSTLFMSYLFIYCYKQVMREWIQCRGTCSTPTEHNVDAPDIVQLLAVGLRNHRTSRDPLGEHCIPLAVVVM